MRIKKVFNLFGMAVGIAAVLCLTIILIVNQGFYVGVNKFIPESNNIIRLSEIVIGLVTLPILIKLTKQEIYCEND